MKLHLYTHFVIIKIQSRCNGRAKIKEDVRFNLFQRTQIESSIKE